MEKIKPLFKKGKQDFKWRLDKEIKEEQKNIDLRDTLGQAASYLNDWHKQKIGNWRKYTLPLPYLIDIGCQHNAIRQEGNNCQEENKNKLTHWSKLQER